MRIVKCAANIFIRDDTKCFCKTSQNGHLGHLLTFVFSYIFMFMLLTAFMCDYVQQKQKIIMYKKANSYTGTDGKHS
jgi:hypothetical protein